MTKPDFERKIITTTDGSNTLFVPGLNEHYHSIHGAIQESEHVFIKNGLQRFPDFSEISILEIGFGTGLNVLLTWLRAREYNMKIKITSIEKYPLIPEEFNKLNYSLKLGTEANKIFQKIHTSLWDEYVQIATGFQLKKQETDLLDFTTNETYNLVYFDAFAPDIQPKLWTAEVFLQMYNLLEPGGILVTYSAKGQVRRNMQTAGFEVKRVPGPPGKREMLKAIKIQAG